MSNEPPVLNKAQATTEPLITGTESGKKGRLDWLLNNKLALLGMLFFVTAALGLPLLWKSKKFSATEKTTWSIVVSIYTIAILWIFCAIMWWSYSRIAESLS